MLDGIRNFLQFINDNWTILIAIFGLAIGIAKKVKDYFSKSDEEKIAIAKKQIQESILKWISDAEESYVQWTKAGSIKRAQVIAKVYADYPILSKVMDQEALIQWLDEAIDNALDELRKIVQENGGSVPSTSNISIEIPNITADSLTPVEKSVTP